MYQVYPDLGHIPRLYLENTLWVCSVPVTYPDSHVIYQEYAWYKAATIAQTDEWLSERRTRLYHSCVDILAQQVNDLTGRDIFFRFGDQKYRRSRVFLDFLCLDGDEVSNATMCPTTRCTTCWCQKDQMSDTFDH